MVSSRAWPLFFVSVIACGGSDAATSPPDAGADAGTTATSTPTATSTSPCDVPGTTTATTTSGCAVRERDTSACEAERKAQGLSGAWLEFSCRVTLGTSGGAVTARFDGEPDYKSFYYASANACYEAYTGATKNPNTIAALDLTMTFPATSSPQSSKMRGAVVGVALNGVPIFGNFAAPGDDIFQEAMTFDRCAGHPQDQGVYHYHAEPLALTSDDANLVGVLLDGYPVYGRRDADGSMPTLDSDGGHTGTTAHSTTPVYHYHVNEQTSTGARTGGEKQWFLTTGTYHGATGTCSGAGC